MSCNIEMNQRSHDLFDYLGGDNLLDFGSEYKGSPKPIFDPEIDPFNLQISSPYFHIEATE